MNNKTVYDIAIIGGGINGTAIAMTAANLGLKVFLCEKNDLASGTSGQSSKLIHGGLRYLQQYQFKLVKEGLEDRQTLLKEAKHLVKPLNFILPQQKNLQRFALRLGLFLYDHLARNTSLPKTKRIDLEQHPAGKYLKDPCQLAFQYSDCQTDDARLVIANALAAKKRGAQIHPYTQCTAVQREEHTWSISLLNQLSQMKTQICARVLINATGPWAEDFIRNILGIKPKHTLALVKGSHIVLPKLYEEEFAYILQTLDHRVVFVMPYLSHFHLIGTTESDYLGDLEQITTTTEDIDYLLNVLQYYFNIPISKANIIHTYSGVRPLVKTKETRSSAISRGYVIEIDDKDQEAPLVSILGGKLTTHRSLARKVMQALNPYFPQHDFTQVTTMILPGSDYGSEEVLLSELTTSYPWIAKNLLLRYANAYGTLTKTMLINCSTAHDLGKDFGAQLYQCEIDYLIKNEWASCAQDILWRRSKLGYAFPKENISTLNQYITEKITCLKPENS